MLHIKNLEHIATSKNAGVVFYPPWRNFSRYQIEMDQRERIIWCKRCLALLKPGIISLQGILEDYLTNVIYVQKQQKIHNIEILTKRNLNSTRPKLPGLSKWIKHCLCSHISTSIAKINHAVPNLTKPTTHFSMWHDSQILGTRSGSMVRSLSSVYSRKQLCCCNYNCTVYVVTVRVLILSTP